MTIINNGSHPDIICFLNKLQTIFFIINNDRKVCNEDGDWLIALGSEKVLENLKNKDVKQQKFVL